jgi:hypothetical protein
MAQLAEQFGKLDCVCCRFQWIAKKTRLRSRWLMHDSTVLQAHQHLAGKKSDTMIKRLGRSPGAVSTKTYPCINALGNVVGANRHRRSG